ncbi:MAG TPA: glycosyltransferase [Gemmatimonadales bacterium]|nr:glycosyltransferase [Gemmatimonadales bacterium]
MTAASTAPTAPTAPVAPVDTRTILLYAQDNQGLGHITRTLTIARHVLARYPNSVAYITTKSPIASNFTLPERCDYIKLPSLLTGEGVQRTAEEGEVAKQHLRAIRGRILREAALGLAPDLVLVDHEPLGAKGEFREGLWMLKAQRPGTKFIFGLRDIMDDEARIQAQWRELGVYDALERLYDGIAVYGSPRLYDVARAYAIPASVQDKLHYCGYIVREPPAVDPVQVRRRHGLAETGPLIVATAGSGSDGYPVLAVARDAVARLQAQSPDLVAIIVTGPFMPAPEQARLLSGATERCRVVPTADTLQLMAVADAIVSMGGYNSVCEALAAARPLVVVPRATHKIEQQIRAETLAAHGLVRWIHPRELDATRLAEALEWALGRDRRAHARLVREVIPSFDGAARLTAYLAQWLGSD